MRCCGDKGSILSDNSLLDADLGEAPGSGKTIQPILECKADVTIARFPGNLAKSGPDWSRVIKVRRTDVNRKDLKQYCRDKGVQAGY